MQGWAAAPNASQARRATSSCRPPTTGAPTSLHHRWTLLREQRRARRRPASPLPRAAAAPANGAAGPPPPTPHPLVSLVRSHAGGAVDGVRPVAGGGDSKQPGWGLEADRDLPRGHRVIVLPAACHLTFESTAARARSGGGADAGGAAADGADGDGDGASAADALASLAGDIPAELWGARLALALLRERALGRGQGGDGGQAGATAPAPAPAPASSASSAPSPFAAYVEALPAAFPGVPLFFAPEAVDALDYPPVAEQVKRRCRWLHGYGSRHLETDAARAAFGGARVDVGALGWALAAVTSRAFRLGGEVGAPAALLPLADLCNHSFDPNAEVVPWEDAARAGGGGGGVTSGGNGGGNGGGGGGRGVAVVTKRALKKGEPVLLSYGPLPNDFLLLDYGFVVRDNPHDAVSLRFDPQGLLSAGAAAAGVLREEAGLAPLPGVRGGGGGGGAPPELLDFADELERSPYKRRRLAALGLLPPGDAAQGGGGGGGASLEVAIGAGRAAGGGGGGNGGGGGAPVADPRLLAAARLLASRSTAETDGLPDRELGAWARSADAPAGAVCPLGNRAGEVAALRALAGAAGVALGRFRSTVEEDEAALAALESPPGAAGGGGASASARADLALAVTLRAEKKRVLLGAIKALGARVAAVRARRDIPALPAAGAGGGAAAAAAPGQKPRPATDRGFGVAGAGGGKKKR